MTKFKKQVISLYMFSFRTIVINKKNIRIKLILSLVSTHVIVSLTGTYEFFMHYRECLIEIRDMQNATHSCNDSLDAHEYIPIRVVHN